MSNVFYECEECGKTGLYFGPHFALECPQCKGKSIYIDRDYSDEEGPEDEDDAD